MNRRKKSINSILVLIVLSALIPAILFGILAYGLMYGYIRADILEAQQTVLNHYTGQTDAMLENLDSYVLNLLHNRDWGGLLRDKGDYQYENQKVVLAKELKLKTAENGIGKADAIGCYLKHSGDYIFAYEDISYEESRLLAEWEKERPVQSWFIVKIDGKDYLYEKYENVIMSVGVLVKWETVVQSWNDASEFLMSSGKSSDKGKNYFLYSELEHGNVTLTVQIPYSHIQKVMPLQAMFMLVTVLAWVLITFLLLYLLKQYIAGPLEEMATIIQRIKSGEKELRISGCNKTSETEAIEVSFNELMDQIYHLEIHNYKMEIENQKSQLMNLQLQINPHMLLNALNTVYGLAEIEEYENIQIFTMNLVKYFRYSLKNTDTLVTLGQELDFIKSYVEIQKIRYPDSFYIVYHVEDELLDERIPPFIIQNFVENSIKYARGFEMVEILVIVTRKSGRLQISICDDGTGIEDSILEELKKERYFERDGETHVGIYNCIRRLRLFYGENMKYSITSRLNEGTQIWIEIPSGKEDI